MPARVPYAAAAALVLPVEAQTIALAPSQQLLLLPLPYHGL